MANKISYMTKEGYEKLKSELDELRSTERQKIARQIAEAREKETFPKMPNMMQLKRHRGCLNLRSSKWKKCLQVPES
jgi:transcription elongation factor GreA